MTSGSLKVPGTKAPDADGILVDEETYHSSSTMRYAMSFPKLDFHSWAKNLVWSKPRKKSLQGLKSLRAHKLSPINADTTGGTQFIPTSARPLIYSEHHPSLLSTLAAIIRKTQTAVYLSPTGPSSEAA